MPDDSAIIPGAGYVISVLRDCSLTYSASSFVVVRVFGQTAVPEEALAVSFTYDGDGGRVKQVADNASTTYVGSLFEERSASDGSRSTVKHIYLGDNRVCAVSSTPDTQLQTPSYIHSDHLGSSSIITDASGDVVQEAHYTPYGGFLNGYPQSSSELQTPNSQLTHFFNSKELDSSGLYYYSARYYDPELGRFTQADTVVQSPYNPQTLNRYSYCNNNPINLVDPTGHSWWSKWFGKIFGFMVGFLATLFTGNMMVGFQMFNLVNSIGNTVNSGNWGGFAGGLVGGMLGGWAGVGLSHGLSGWLGENSFTFAGGFAIGATEMGLGGFGAGVGSVLGEGGSFSDAMKAGGMGFATGAVIGGLVEGTYLSRMQNIAHGDSREDVYNNGIQRIRKLSVKESDFVTAIVGSRPIEKGGIEIPGRHRYIRGKAGRFEMGEDDLTGLIEINGEHSVGDTDWYLKYLPSKVMEATIAVSQWGIKSSINLYKAAWVGSQYNWSSYNSNFAVNSVIYGAGGNVPGNLGYTPGFPDNID